ncbi:hypothetical protein [Allohahella marinimesophila]|uniref:Uncharacterized protein n=1 Tax=Allohahella marinimesophila TaxID=1054972 RepID=A0ABP7NU30_9GAMM
MFLKNPLFRGQLLATLALTTLVTGCTTTETHYSRFRALDSSGEPRNFVMYWNSELPKSWYGGVPVVTPVRIKTQCSDEIIEFQTRERCGAPDKRTPDGLAAGWCGAKGEFLTAAGREIEGSDTLCGWITGPAVDGDGFARSTSELGSEVLVTIACYPASSVEAQKQASKDKAGERKAGAILRASAVPYRLTVRSAPADSLSDRVPELDEKVCSGD